MNKDVAAALKEYRAWLRRGKRTHTLREKARESFKKADALYSSVREEADQALSELIKVAHGDEFPGGLPY